MKKYTMIILGCFCLSLTSNVYSYPREPRMYKDAASMGMGGVGVSTIGYSFSAIHNPAALGLMADHEIAPFLSLGMSMNPEMFKLLEDVKSVATGEKSFESIDYDSLMGNAPKIGINGPLSAGYMGKGFGFWTTTSADASMSIINNPDNILAKNGINVSMNDLVGAGSDIAGLGDSPSQADITTIMNKYFSDDFASAGLSDAEIAAFAAAVAKDPNLLKTLIPQAKFDATAEVTVNLAYGYKIPFAFLDDVSGLSFGATVRFSQRFKITSGDKYTSVDQLGSTFANITEQVYQAGSISSDFGTALRIENFIFGLSVRDALSTGYYWKNMDGVSGGIENSKIALSLDFGFSYRFYFANNFIQEVGLYLEFEDSLMKHETWLNKMRVGTEVKLFNFLDLRVGMYDSFITGGIGMGWKWFRMDFAYYRENYFNFFKSDQYYLNMTVGLDNSPQRKANTILKQQQHDRIQAQALEMVNDSLKGVGI